MADERANPISAAELRDIQSRYMAKGEAMDGQRKPAPPPPTAYRIDLVKLDDGGWVGEAGWYDPITDEWRVTESRFRQDTAEEAAKHILAWTHSEVRVDP